MSDTNILKPRKRIYGWRPDVPDRRDLMSPRKVLTPANLPAEVQLRDTGFFGTPDDQGDLGSCTGNGCAKLMRYDLAKQGKPVVEPSRLFIYYGERVIENSVSEDSGAEVRDGMKVLNHLGAPDEKLWPYDVKKFAQKPPQAAFDDAAKRKCIKYTRVPNTITALVSELAQGFPIVLGFSVYESFESDEVAKTGIVPNPKADEQMLGGHCVVLCGYKKMTRSTYMLTFLNSWSDQWGDKGYFHTKSSFLRDCGASDFWTCETTT